MTASNDFTVQAPPPGSLVAGRWLEGEREIAVLDKYTGQIAGSVMQATREQVAQAVQVTACAAAAQPLAPVDRARILHKTAELVDAQRQRFVSLMIAEAGFTVADASTEVDRSLITLHLCAEEATRLVGETVSFSATPGQHTRLGFTIRRPLGVVCAITPFNSPLNTLIHKVAPALAGGNGVVLKPSVLTPLTGALFCETLLQAGLPPELLALVHGDGESVGNWLLEEQAIAFYSFTGSTRVGKEIQRGAGIRKTQLELGSISSVIVCADADLRKAATKIANASFRKAGQVCTSVQRLYVEESCVAELTRYLLAATAAMPAGNPRDPAVRVGPMISTASATRIQAWIGEAVEDDAQIVVGGTLDGPVHQPTILSYLNDTMKVVAREAFAPILCMLPFNDLQQAFVRANSSPYGLAAGIFTNHLDKGLAAAQSLRFGAVHINETSSSRADAMPFGGVKDSGFGHEGPAYAIREVTEERLVTFNP